MPSTRKRTRPAEMEAAQEPTMESVTKMLLDEEIGEFANHLEIARIVYKRHARLVTAKNFPEPYRAAIIKAREYDPDEVDNVNINDLHITDPVEAQLKHELAAKEGLAKPGAAKGK